MSTRDDRKKAQKQCVCFKDSDATWALENEHLLVKVNSVGCLDVLEKATRTQWGHDPWNESPGRVVFLDREKEKQAVCDLEKAQILIERLSDNNNPSPPFQQIVRKGVRIRFTSLRDETDRLLDGSNVEIEIWINEDNPDVYVKVCSIASGSDQKVMDELSYPLRSFFLKTGIDEGCLVMPIVQGSIFPMKMPYERMFFTNLPYIWPGTGGLNTRFEQLSMSWFGAVKCNSAFIGIVETPDDAAFQLHSHYSPLEEDRISCCTPVWRSSMQQLCYKRMIRYHFMPYGSYVSMAKYYRQYVIEKGGFKSLQEKMCENPEVEKLVGAPLICFGPFGHSCFGSDGYYSIRPPMTYRHMQEILEDMKKSGIDRALINPWGWSSIDSVAGSGEPVLPERWIVGGAGTVQDLKSAVETAKNNGYLFALYDDPYNIPETAGGFSKEILLQDPDGTPTHLRLAGIYRWDHIWWWICPQAGLEHTKKKLPAFTKFFGVNAHFPDTLTAHLLHECYHPNHTLTRGENRESRVELLKFVKSLNIVVGSETGYDWAIPYIDFLAGISGTKLGVPVPLFNLVYHDAVVCQRHHNYAYNDERDIGGPEITKGQTWEAPYGVDFIPKFLRDLLYGNVPIFVFNEETYKQWKPRLKVMYDLICALHRETAFDELTDHRFLSAQGDVQQTWFSSGATVTVNFGSGEFVSQDGITIPPKGFCLNSPKIGIKVKRFSLDLIEEEGEGSPRPKNSM